MSNNSSAIDLADLAGLDRAKALLGRIVAEGSGVHAVLLYGVKGSGKSTLANWLARTWLCKSPNSKGGCGECASCKAFRNGNSADVLAIAPKGKSSWIKLNTITPCEDDEKEEPPPLPVIEFLRTMALSSRHKVVIIHEADRMVNRASNALLKTLEEPPEYARFILTTNRVASMFPTILSRCVCVACELPMPRELSDRLGDIEPWELRLSEGSLGEITRIRENRDLYEGIVGIAERSRGGSRIEALRHAEDLRRIAEELGKRTDMGARAANAEAIRAFGAALGLFDSNPGPLEAIAESHRRVVGNAQMSIVTDALMTRLAS